MVTIIFYLMQIVQAGQLVLPKSDVLKGLFFARTVEEGEGEPMRPHFLMSVYDNMEAFLFGMGRIFPALIVLTLAWAVGSVMSTVGVDRLFSSWILGGILASLLPTLSFIISAFVDLATGTSWGVSIICVLCLVLMKHLSHPFFFLSDHGYFLSAHCCAKLPIFEW
jgi:hypothetical protein